MFRTRVFRQKLKGCVEKNEIRTKKWVKNRKNSEKSGFWTKIQAYNALKTPENHPKWLQNRLKWLQTTPKRLQNQPERLQNCRKIREKRPKTVNKSAKKRQNSPKIVKNNTKMHEQGSESRQNAVRILYIGCRVGFLSANQACVVRINNARNYHRTRSWFSFANLSDFVLFGWKMTKYGRILLRWFFRHCLCKK